MPEPLAGSDTEEVDVHEGHCDCCGADSVLVAEFDWYDGPLYACASCCVAIDAERAARRRALRPEVTDGL